MSTDTREARERRRTTCYSRSFPVKLSQKASLADNLSQVARRSVRHFSKSSRQAVKVTLKAAIFTLVTICSFLKIVCSPSILAKCLVDWIKCIS